MASKRFIAIGGIGVLLLMVGIAALALLGNRTASQPPGPSGPAPSSSSATGVTTIVVPSLNPDTGIEAVSLEPGTYRFERLSPAATFVVPQGNWWAYRDYIDAAGLYLLDPGVEDVPPAEDTLIGFLDLGRVQVVFDGVCLDSDTILLDSSANALIDWLQGHELLETSNALPVNMAGYSGLQVDVTVGSLPAERCETDRPAPGIFLFPVGEDYFSLFPDDRLRVITLDVSGRPFSILVSSPAGRFDTFAEASRPVLESLRLTP